MLVLLYRLELSLTMLYIDLVLKEAMLDDFVIDYSRYLHVYEL